MHLEAQIRRYFIRDTGVDDSVDSTDGSGKISSFMAVIIQLSEVLSTPYPFFLFLVIRISVMFKYKEDRVLLLRALRDLVTENMDASSMNPFAEQDVAEYLTEVTDKRRARKLKYLRRELDQYIAEIVQQQSLEKQERLFNEVKLKQINESYASHCDSAQ